jgi:hypothetical protein
MYFNQRDEVSIHTLAGAAHILITDLSKAAQLQSVIDRHIKPDMRWKFEGAIRKPQNFLKHGRVSQASAGFVFFVRIFVVVMRRFLHMLLQRIASSGSRIAAIDIQRITNRRRPMAAK